MESADATVKMIGRVADRIAKAAGHVAGRIAEIAGRVVHRDKMQEGKRIRSRRLTEISAKIRNIPLFEVTRDLAAARIRRISKGISPL